MYSQIPSQKRQVWLRTCFDTDDLVTQANSATYNEAEHWHMGLEWKTVENSETSIDSGRSKTNIIFINCILLTFEENFLRD